MASEKILSKIIDQILKKNHNGEKNNDQFTEENNLYQEIDRILSSDKDSKMSAHVMTDYNTCFKPSEHTQLLPGKVWIKDNEIYVEGLPGINVLPCIIPTKGVDLFVNHQRVNGKTAVSEHDYIYVDLHVKKKPFHLTIDISKDGLIAYMSVQLQVETRYKLIDQPPKQHIELKTTTTTKKYCPVGMDEILTRIEDAGIKYGVDYPAIQQFLANPRDGKYIIASGVPPTDSKDDVVDVLFHEKVIKHQYSNNEKIDFFNQKSIPSVDAGNLLAVKREGKVGQPGISVFGDIVLPKEPKKLVVRAGKGVRVEGNMVFANMSGRPMVKRIGQVRLFYVEPYLRHYGDIDLSTGNQNFRGNIEVYGDVCNGVSVRAGGNIQIMGSVNRAKVMAMESVLVDKCIGSIVQAGGDSHYIGNCYITLKNLHADLKSLSTLVGVILDNPKLSEFKNQLPQIVLLLMEKKFNRIPKLLKETVHILEITPVDMPSEIKVLLEMIKEQIPPRNLTKHKLQLLIDYVELAKDFFAQLGDVPADVEVGHAFNSVIAATNDVYVSSQGCFNTNITAGRNVFIGGVMRGGKVYAKGSITVEEAGSEIGTKTILHSESAEIKILKKIYDGVVVIVGERRIEITNTMGPTEFRNEMEK
ncbi:DUF342 domain-containing protein [Desulfallas thermosapovorans]|uniref:Flagellar Assembly Protein A N-terminal region domain-containing protein n=1 Tax=Desulfallas thermosapovorans DSM 6562 TaxID=1121431 RepID=A0A5S4ZPK2_9FIRM|nr:FapA family protein [Desulfallas thermosapovorans]TYO94477.1 hypothetical protein LX24_02464 [Desulfallas thermosapovorans DSM 6562]